MAIDRTSELLGCFHEDPAKEIKPKLRNRHRADRFAVEDQTSPCLAEVGFSDSDLERTTPPATFIAKANSILSEINEARRLMISSAKVDELRNNSIQPILDLCLQHIKILQEFSEEQSDFRSARKGWLATLIIKRDSQLDQHEAVVIWFLNHQLSTLSREYEKAKDDEEEKINKKMRLKMSLHDTLAANRPIDRLAKPELMSSEQFMEEYRVSEEQMQELALENDNLLKEFTEMQEQLNTTQGDLNEIVRLQTTLQEHLVYQSTQIDRLFDEAITTTEIVKKANAQLSRAASHQSTSVRLFLYFVFFATIFLLLLHFISD